MGYRNRLQIKYISGCIMTQVLTCTNFGPASCSTGETQYCKFCFGFARTQASLDEARILTQTFFYQILESSMKSWDGIGQAFKEYQLINGEARAVSSTSE